MNGQDKLDYLRNYMSDTQLLEELLQALSDSEKNENADFIARMHDIQLDDDEE